MENDSIYFPRFPDNSKLETFFFFGFLGEHDSLDCFLFTRPSFEIRVKVQANFALPTFTEVSITSFSYVQTRFGMINKILFLLTEKQTCSKENMRT
jgi:hypothetical protein